MNFETTQYGFIYGPATVERACSDDKMGWIVLRVGTKKHPYLQLYITKTGKVRVYDARGEWTPPEAKKPK